jgi:outer membrane protein
LKMVLPDTLNFLAGKIKFISLVMVAVSLRPALAQSPGSGPLTLQEAVTVALKNNPTVKAAGAYAEAVQHGIAEAKASRYPHFDFSEAFTRGNNPVYVFGSLLTQRQFTASDFALNALNAPLPLDNFLTQFTGSVPLYDGGQISRRIRDARLQAETAAQQKQRTRQEVIFQVIEAYTRFLLAQESVRVAEASVAMTKSDLHRAQARLQQGIAVSSDVLSAQAQVAQAEEDLLSAQNSEAVAHAALNVAMGLAEDAPSRIAGRLSETQFSAGELAERDQAALRLRPDLAGAQLGQQRATNAAGLARAAFLPQISLFSSWETANQTFAGLGGHNWTAGATLTFNIFDGGRNAARLAAAHAKQRQAADELSSLIASVRLQVREAYSNLVTAGKRIEVARAAVSQARDSLRILQNRYDAGLITITDLLQAETARTRAEENYLNAIFDYRVSYAALELATGQLSPNSGAVTH